MSINAHKETSSDECAFEHMVVMTVTILFLDFFLEIINEGEQQPTSRGQHFSLV